MTTKPPSNPTDFSPTPCDAALERALDTLARADADAAPAGLEQRLADATAPLLRATHRHAPRDAEHRSINLAGRRSASHTTGSRRAGHVRLRWAIAAGLGAMVCVTAWLALRAGTTSPSVPRLADGAEGGSAVLIALDPQVEADALFAASSLLALGFDSELESISTSAAALGLSLTSPLDSADFLSNPMQTSPLEGESL